ncbi:hypothetical protein AMC99_02736 [Altererythrobacter epoxidivorans]|uniref:Uncharacterized protein n=1 Tax=Altererythrobacter epoxidivorans TaxID=361183 RepID=A0A0M5L7H5_9SPHN|nr:hypothetical protein AMC99_02736 [Altererythrobacter epoxidivorans]
MDYVLMIPAPVEQGLTREPMSRFPAAFAWHAPRATCF